MTRRTYRGDCCSDPWDWTWEDRSQANRTPPVAPDESGEDPDTPSSAGAAPPPRPGTSPVVRRRRATVLVVTIVLLVVLIAAVGAHKSSGKTHVVATNHRRNRSAAHPGRTRGRHRQGRRKSGQLRALLYARGHQRRLARQRAGAHLRRRTWALHAAARRHTRPVARACDVLRDRRSGAVLLARHDRRDQIW